MESQMVIHIDSELKQNAMEMAKKEWLTMKALMCCLLKSYVRGDIEFKACLCNDKK